MSIEILAGKNLENWMRGVAEAVKKGKIGFSEDGTMIVFEGAQAGGVFEAQTCRHEFVQRAIDDKDPEKELYMRDLIIKKGFDKTREGFFLDEMTFGKNILPSASLTFQAGLLLSSSVTKISNWYHGPIVNNVVPDLTWLANWANAASGPKGQELAAAHYVAGARMAAVFPAAATNGVISQSSRTAFVFTASASGITAYGSTLNSSQSVAATAGTLAAAGLFDTPKGPFGNTDELLVGYTFGISNAA